MLGQEDHIVGALAERGNVEDDDRQSVVEVGAEATRGDQLPEVLRRRGDELHVDAVRRNSAQTADALLLDRLQELPLEDDRQGVDLVKEERPSGGGLEEPGLGPPGVGEGAGLEAEELGLEHRLRDGRAVNVDEGCSRPAAARVDDAGDEPLSGARLPLEKDRRNVRIPGRIEGGEVANLPA